MFATTLFSTRGLGLSLPDRFRVKQISAAKRGIAPDSLLGRLVHFATVLTQVGEEWLVDKIDETVQTTADYIGWGTGAGTAAKGDTALFTEAAESRVLATRSQVLADKVRWVGTLTSASGQTITNAGNFTASSGGTLVVHGDFTGVALSTGDQIQFTIDLEIT